MKTFTCAQTGLVRNLDEERAAERKRSEAIISAAKALRAAEIERICQRHELESDEFQTREEKALEILKRERR